MNIRTSLNKKLCHYSITLCFFFLLPGSVYAGFSDISRLISNGGYALVSEKGIVQFRADESFIPASTLKILTCLAALETLGPDYRFETHFFLDKDNNLYIQGFGDPFLTSETVLDIAVALRSQGVIKLETIYLDSSAFHLNIPPPGSSNSSNPYDAPNGALAVNFNALPFAIARDGTVSSGEEQTPLLPLMQDIAPGLSPGTHRFNVNALNNSTDIPLPLRYTGELFSAQFKQAKIITNGHFLPKTTPQNLRPFFIHYSSKSLEEMVKSCLKFSNNFIANQLFLICGATTFQFPATWEKANRFMDNFITSTLMLSKKQARVVEGSGLSHLNSITSLAFLHILKRFRPYAHLLSKKGDILLKSGTLNNVFCFAGYLHEKTLNPFVILLNQPENTRDNILKIFHTTIPR